jgi:hypothetical protein
MIEQLKTFLEQFGKVEVCEMPSDEEVKIKITKGFKNDMEGMLICSSILNKIEELSGNEFPYIREVTMDKDLFQAIFYTDGVERYT